MGAHSNPGKVAFQFDDLHLILEKLLCGKAYSRGVSFFRERCVFFGEHLEVIFHFPTSDYVTHSLSSFEFLELLSLWPTSRPSFSHREVAVVFLC